MGLECEARVGWLPKEEGQRGVGTRGEVRVPGGRQLGSTESWMGIGLRGCRWTKGGELD
jgi:hypothetical protein